MMYFHASATYRGEDLLICGGFQVYTQCFTLNMYDVTETWQTTVEPLRVPVMSHTMTTVGETESVAVVGGRHGVGRRLNIVVI